MEMDRKIETDGREWRPCQKVKELYPDLVRCERPASVRKMKARGSSTPICDECLPSLAIWPTDGPESPKDGPQSLQKIDRSPEAALR